MFLRKILTLWIGLILFPFSGEASDLPIWDQADGPAAFIEKLSNERATIGEQSWSTWNSIGQMDRPLENRLIDLSPSSALLARSYMDLFFSFGNQARQPLPMAMPADPGLRRDLQEAIQTLPPVVKKLLSPYLAAIVPITNVPVNGLAALVLDEKGQQRGGISYLNVDRLNKTANAWWSFKESSPYTSDANNQFALEATIDPDPQFDTRVKAIQFILIHELGHILAYGVQAFPRWDILPTPFAVGDYPYLDISWVQKNGADVLNPTEMQAFGSFTGKLVYFKDDNKFKKLNNADLPKVFEALQNTSFITPYATTDPHEDFADFFALYILTDVMKLKPSFSIRSANGSIVAEYKMAELIYENRFERKRNFVNFLMNNL